MNLDPITLTVERRPAAPPPTATQHVELVFAATPKPRRPRLLCFDLENRPLAYWYDGQTTAEITAFGWKWSDERKVHTLLLRADGAFVDDAGVAYNSHFAYQMFVLELGRADVVFGHNIRRHDLKLIAAGLDRLQLPSLRPLRTTDTLRDIPRGKDLSYSLENLASRLGLHGKKYTLSQPEWESANRLTADGIELARRRVASDVRLQERLRARLVELGRLGPPRAWTP